MNKSCIVVALFLSSLIHVKAQKADTLHSVTLEGVTVTSYKEKPASFTSLNLSVLKTDSLSRYGNFNLTDLVAREPGVNMLSTGVAIAKPVIRGLYGNRVLVLVSGLRFDNQQWQEEHGMGLSDIGLSRVEVIKGPMSVLYGSEAIGGIINLVEEEKPPVNTSQSDIGFRFHSNTLGGMLQAGYKEHRENKWWRIRVVAENHADYSDGNGNRVLNSRFDGYQLKATYGFQKKNWTSNNNLLSSFNRYGFIFNDIYSFVTPDDRWSRRLNENPAHLVLLNLLSSEHKFELKNESRLNLNVGVQSNERMENEGGGAISLNMHLLTVQYLLKWEKSISTKTKMILTNLGSFEDNTNFGARKIVPDANLQESNISACFETTLNRNLILENGLGVGEKWIKTYFTASVNDPEKEIHPFTKSSWYYNFFSGVTAFPSMPYNIKVNVATGVRIPNLAELSSNGLHEGVFTYEIGDPDMKNEQNAALNVEVNARGKYLEVALSPFYNYFFNYVYLAPTDESWFGFPVFRYQQQNATQYGSEFRLMIKPVERLNVGATVSAMISKTKDGYYTPFVPAAKVSPHAEFTFPVRQTRGITLFVDVDHAFKQTRVAPLEVATGSYTIWNGGMSLSVDHESRGFTVSITGNNLFNEAYIDHLSRFKYFGLLNIGRNIVLNFNYRF